VGGHVSSELLQGVDGALNLPLPTLAHLVDDDWRVRGNTGELYGRHGDTLEILYSRGEEQA